MEGQWKVKERSVEGQGKARGRPVEGAGSFLSLPPPVGKRLVALSIRMETSGQASVPVRPSSCAAASFAISRTVNTVSGSPGAGENGASPLKKSMAWQASSEVRSSTSPNGLSIESLRPTLFRTCARQAQCPRSVPRSVPQMGALNGALGCRAWCGPCGHPRTAPGRGSRSGAGTCSAASCLEDKCLLYLLCLLCLLCSVQGPLVGF